MRLIEMRLGFANVDTRKRVLVVRAEVQPVIFIALRSIFNRRPSGKGEKRLDRGVCLSYRYSFLSSNMCFMLCASIASLSLCSASIGGHIEPSESHGKR